MNNLKESEEKYKNIFGLSPLPMWVVDVESGYFLDVNDAAIRSYGYTRTEFLGLAYKQIVHETDLPAQETKEEIISSNSFFQEVSKHKKKMEKLF